jgi:hypothetical protein
MLPKPEKIKKVKTEQLDLVEKISDEDKIRKKRKYLIISIICTVGISAIFYCYRQLESLNLRFKMPAISLNFDKRPKFTNDKDISLYIKSDNFFYEYQSDLISDIDETLFTLDTAPTKTIDNLPSGVEVRGFVQDDISAYCLSVPARNIKLIIKSNDLQKTKELIEKIYWHLINQR